VRFLNLFKLALVAVAISAWYFQPIIARGQDAPGVPAADQTQREPVPPQDANTLATQMETSQSNAASIPVEGKSEVADDNNHLGIGHFARLPFNLSTSVLFGFDDNVNTTTTNENSSPYITPNANLTYKFVDSRTEADLTAGAGFNYYLDEPNGQTYDVTTSFGLSIRHEASPRLTFNANAYLSYLTEPDFNVSVPNRRSGNYFYTSDQLKATYLWHPRFATATSYSLFFTNYDDDMVGRFVDRAENTFGNEFRFLYKPTTTLLAEFRYQIVSYTQTAQSSSDSTTEFLLAGVEHAFNPRLNISLRGGAQFRSFDSGEDRTEPYFESALAYTAGKRTTINWTTQYSLEEPGISGNPSRTTFRTGLQANYGFTSRISSTLGFYYVNDDYEHGPPIIIPPFVIQGAPAFSEDSVDANLTFRYQFNRDLAALAGYGHTQVFSDRFGRDYSRNRVFGGVTFAF